MTIKYEKGQGFDERDLLKRKYIGDVLTSLAKSESNRVVLLNAEWGEGKTSLVNMWRGELDKEQELSYHYFDAFESDFIADPFQVILGQYLRVRGGTVGTNLANAAFGVTKAITRGAIRVGANYLLKGAAESIVEDVSSAAFGEAVDDTITEGVAGADKAVKALFKSLEEDLSSVQVFRRALAEDVKEKPLVVIVDELDRCRPDYALELLERIKHLFSVENITWVLVANQSQLRASVGARHGCDGEQAAAYLRKFVDVEIQLPREAYNGALAARYFESRANSVFRGSAFDQDLVRQLFGAFRFSLRDVEQFIRFLEIVWDRVWIVREGDDRECPNDVLALIALKIAKPASFELILKRTTWNDFRDSLGIDEPDSQHEFKSLLAPFGQVLSAAHPTKDRVKDHARAINVLQLVAAAHLN